MGQAGAESQGRESCRVEDRLEDSEAGLLREKENK